MSKLLPLRSPDCCCSGRWPASAQSGDRSFRLRLPRRIAFDNGPSRAGQSGAWQFLVVNPATGFPGTDRTSGDGATETGRAALGNTSQQLALPPPLPAATVQPSTDSSRISIVAAGSAPRRIQRRQRAARVARPVAGQRDKPERARWRRQEFADCMGFWNRRPT